MKSESFIKLQRWELDRNQQYVESKSEIALSFGANNVHAASESEHNVLEETITDYKNSIAEAPLDLGHFVDVRTIYDQTHLYGAGTADISRRRKYEKVTSRFKTKDDHLEKNGLKSIFKASSGKEKAFMYLNRNNKLK